MSDKDIISDLQLENCFINVSTQTGVALAVSGGPDSMALLLLMDRWRRKRLKLGQPAPDLTILTIDHGLRKESGEECQFVLDKADELGYEAELLHWSGPKPTTRIQEMAREFRYQQMVAACHLRGIKTLMTAHHLDDQAETFLMRLARGSGVDGLSAMAIESRRYGLRLLRPLLDFEKADLIAQLDQSGWSYRIDPSNTDTRFERVRLREGKEELEKLGLSSQMIGLAASRLRRAKTALNEISNDFLAKNVFITDYGTARVDQLAFSDAPDEIAIRALSKLLKLCGGSQDVANMARLENLTEKLKDDFSTNRTLAGCRLIAKGDFWLILREAGRILELEKPIVPDGCMFWDNRFIVCADKTVSDKIVAGPLVKVEDLAFLEDEKILVNVPKEAFGSLLALHCEGELIAVPAVDYWQSEAISAGLQAKLITGDDCLV